MHVNRPDDDARERDEDRGAAWRRRRRLAEVFGDSLPDTTSDERDPGERSSRGGRGESSGDAWLRAQVPPHHGG